MTDIFLNVADIRHRCRVDGPGVRSVVWVQGCTIGCPGCYNPHTHAHKPVRLLDPEQLGCELADIDGTDGITILGGEPFEQAKACAILAATIHSRNRSVMVFTGYTYDYLQACAAQPVRRFLAAIDLLVAGPFVQQLRCDQPYWLTSSNQTVHVLTDRLAGTITAGSPDNPSVEVATDGKGVLCMGFPEAEDRQWLDQLASIQPERAVCGRKAGPPYAAGSE